MAISDLLELGRQGMNANRSAMETTSNNIANANSPGYSRQRPIMQSSEGRMEQGVRIGGGVELSKVIRVHDQFVQNQLIQESTTLGTLRGSVDALKRVEAVVQRDGEQLDGVVNKFFNDFRELSTNPETPSLRGVVRQSAETLGHYFGVANDSLNSMRTELDVKLASTVTEINQLTSEISVLNGKIALAEAVNKIPNELYDRRDQALREVSGKIDLQVTVDGRNQVTLVTGGDVLVQGENSHQLSAERTEERTDKAPGSLDVFVNSNTGKHRITHRMKEGELAGIIKVRDQVVNQSMKRLDSLATHLATEVNQIHNKGVGLDGLTNRNLFKEIAPGTSGASGMLAITDDVKANFESVATAYEVGVPGDNRVALDIADIQNKIMFAAELSGQGEPRETLSQSINSMVGHVGVITQQDERLLDHAAAVVDQLENYRQSTSGVNIEEESISLLQYQTAFHAAVKTMKLGDELMDTILSLKK